MSTLANVQRKTPKMLLDKMLFLSEKEQQSREQKTEKFAGYHRDCVRNT